MSVYYKVNYENNDRYKCLMKEISINGKKWYVDPIMLVQKSDFWTAFLVGSGDIPPSTDYIDISNTENTILALDILHEYEGLLDSFKQLINVLEIFDMWMIDPELVCDLLFPGYDVYDYSGHELCISKERMQRDIRTVMPFLMKNDLNIREKFCLLALCSYWYDDYAIDKFPILLSYDNMKEVFDKEEDKGLGYLWNLLYESFRKEEFDNPPPHCKLLSALDNLEDNNVTKMIIYICTGLRYKNEVYRLYEDYFNLHANEEEKSKIKKFVMNKMENPLNNISDLFSIKE